MSPITPEEAYRSKHVIRASANGIRCNEFEINPYVREYSLGLGWRADTREISKLNKGTEERIGQILPREFQSGKKIMGVVARGSGARDEVSEAVKRNYRMENIAIVPYIERCEKVMKEEGMDYIFLATEDAEYFQLFQQAFGEKLIFVDQPRIAWEPYIKEVRGGNIKPLGHYLGTGRAVGERYLAVVRGLSMCDMLATNNMACGAFNLARNWNHGKYRRIDTFG